MACSNPYCFAGVCSGPHAPEPHPCKACVARWLAESEAIVDEVEVLFVTGLAPRSALRVAQRLRLEVLRRAAEASAYALEIADGGRWLRCEADGVEYRAETRAEAEVEARVSLSEDDEWRVVEVA